VSTDPNSKQIKSLKTLIRQAEGLDGLKRWADLAAAAPAGKRGRRRGDKYRDLDLNLIAKANALFYNNLAKTPTAALKLIVKQEWSTRLGANGATPKSVVSRLLSRLQPQPRERKGQDGNVVVEIPVNAEHFLPIARALWKGAPKELQLILPLRKAAAIIQK
jgi:hypothetical protein